MFACSNASGLENFLLLTIGQSKMPRCFGGIIGEEQGCLYQHNKKAWMNRAIFYEWLPQFDAYIGDTSGCTVIFLMDNASSHGSLKTMPNLQNVSVYFLPPNTTY